jgi:protein O-GlcNAc transferase
MKPSVVLTLVDGVQIVVPDSLNLITPYVILEQGDWFEDEIKFVRTLLRPGNRVIDIGANYGVYTLSMAKAVGNAGEVWAFEPSTETASFLARGIEANLFRQVTLQRCALSDRQGTARFSNNEFSETNSLLAIDSPGQASEEVHLDTLDNWMENHAWMQVDFIKMDAEGAEESIIRGAAKFLERRSPLIQYEIKAGKSVNMALVVAFSKCGYESFRLVPGLGVLVPFDISGEVDGSLLNLFCCKQDMAEELVKRGLMLKSLSEECTSFSDDVLIERFGWRNALLKFPYGDKLKNLWVQTIAEGKSGDVERAIALYLSSTESSLPVALRWRALDESYKMLHGVCVGDAGYLRLASLARVAKDHGKRVVAVTALSQLTDQISRYGSINLTEPFLVPCIRFQVLPPGNDFKNWIISSILEELETLEVFSSFYTVGQTRGRLELMQQLGYFDGDMARRLALINARLNCREAGDRIPAAFL